jgi:hypothetical protein
MAISTNRIEVVRKRKSRFLRFNTITYYNNLKEPVNKYQRNTVSFIKSHCIWHFCNCPDTKNAGTTWIIVYWFAYNYCPSLSYQSGVAECAYFMMIRGADSFFFILPASTIDTTESNVAVTNIRLYD